MSRTEEEIRSRYEQMYDNQMRTNEQAVADAKKLGNDYVAGLEQANNEYAQQLQKANDQTAVAADEFAGILKGWDDAAQEKADQQRKLNAQQAEQDRRAMRFGGIVEAASALTNLIGTGNGASNQQWQSPMSGWQNRADIMRREREAKLNNYDQQARLLQLQRSQLLYGVRKDQADRQANLANALANAKGKENQAKYTAGMEANKILQTGQDKENQIGMQGAAALARQANDDRTFGLQAAAKASDSAYKEYLMRSGGYDPDTKQFFDPNTGKWGKGPAMTRSGKAISTGDVDADIRQQLQLDPSLLDELARNVTVKRGNIPDYAGYENASDRERKQMNKNSDNRAVLRVLKNLRDGDEKLTVADKAIIKQYAPEYYAKYFAYEGEMNQQASGPANVSSPESGAKPAAADTTKAQSPTDLF